MYIYVFCLYLETLIHPRGLAGLLNRQRYLDNANYADATTTTASSSSNNHRSISSSSRQMHAQTTMLGHVTWMSSIMCAGTACSNSIGKQNLSTTSALLCPRVLVSASCCWMCTSKTWSHSTSDKSKSKVPHKNCLQQQSALVSRI